MTDTTDDWADSPAHGPINARCEQCGAQFHCGLHDSRPCWCATEVPAVVSGRDGGSCLCQRCLAALVSRQQAN